MPEFINILTHMLINIMSGKQTLKNTKMYQNKVKTIFYIFIPSQEIDTVQICKAVY